MNKTNRRKFIAATASLSVAALAANAVPQAKEDIKHPIVHHVFFWLKNPSSKVDRDQLVSGLKTLKKIESIKAIHIGVVASTEKREVVDNSWSVSELMFFETLEGQKIYQDHPIHQEFIKNCSHLWNKVLVYDAVSV
ncbi:MAG: Dabb family protein [Pedobacter sp.]|uniref:Dabb family protein n=1 Tax=Pedobacter sp. TaxID=1411316 RepID=UPI00280755C6|nr:Dabb family protein [Pedobacter sp.]MDQ8003999.1 Dabb family protein [Pedobacter sp.]